MKFKLSSMAYVYMYFNFPKVSVRIKFGEEEKDTGADDNLIEKELKSYGGFFYSSQIHMMSTMDRIKIPSRLYYIILTSDTEFSFAALSPKIIKTSLTKNSRIEFLRYVGEDEYGYHLYCGVLSKESQIELSGSVVSS